VLVATPTLNRSVTTRRASVALRTLVCGPQRRPRRIEIEPALRDVDGNQRVEVGEPLAAGGDRGGSLGRLGRDAATVEESPVHGDAGFPEALPDVVARKDPRIGVRVVGSRVHGNRWLAAGFNRVQPLVAGGDPFDQRLAVRSIDARLRRRHRWRC
jgi:hypothetical protein